VPARALPPPAVGDIVYCRFPEIAGRPGPKPRPALVISIGRFDDGTHAVRVSYGTSRNTERLHAGEFLITPLDRAAFQAAGLSYATKFDLRKLQDLPSTDEWFQVPPAPQFGATPKLGVLHASLYRRAKAAYEG
jgi:hypothetical protein